MCQHQLLSTRDSKSKWATYFIQNQTHLSLKENYGVSTIEQTENILLLLLV